MFQARRLVPVVLHDPIYTEKYALNLKCQFPRIPFYLDFWKWAEWGEKLRGLHLGYETIKPWQNRTMPDFRRELY